MKISDIKIEPSLGPLVRATAAQVDELEADWRDRIKKYWVWDKGTDLLPKARALECVIVGDTGNGDELVFHPRYPDRLFVLGGRGSGSDGRILVAGSDLLSAIEWMVTSGKLTRRFKDRTLRPFDSRTEEREAPEIADPPGESIDDIVKLGRQWARRHRARKQVSDDLPVGLAVMPPSPRETKTGGCGFRWRP